mgnify:CR=1 FL=1
MKNNKRNHCISVLLDDSELSKLEKERIINAKAIPRGTYLRSIFNSSTPSHIPAINRELYRELSRSASNLNQIAHHLNLKESVEIQTVFDALSDFRTKLLRS